MKIHLFHMKIFEELSDGFLILIEMKGKEAVVKFNPVTKNLEFLNLGIVTDILKRNELQFRKVLHIKNPATYHSGFELDFSITDGKNVEEFNDLSKILALNNRKQPSSIEVIKEGLPGIHELWIDGSYMEKKGKGGCAVIIKDPSGNYKLETFTTNARSSSLTELLAAIKGLELLKNIEKIRIVTDSQYVRKGLTEWIINWKLNDWHTANGEKVKNIDHWKKFDSLASERYIEFKYVKAHSQQFENTMADLYARDMAEK
ncbi:MAG: ribonuclease HI [Bacteroidales bacterium]|nr:ribonuclease HI [Bacteroidales bacterium]